MALASTTRWVAQGVVLLVVAASACRPVEHESLDHLAERYVRVTLQLAQHNPDLVDDWRGPETWRPGAREPVAVLRTRIDAIRADLASQRFADRDRVDYLTDQLAALASAATRLGGASVSFEDERQQAWPGIPMVTVDADAARESRQSLDRLLTGAGSLAERYAQYRTRLAVAPAKIEPLMRAALGACRDQSRTLQLPSDEQVDLTFGHGSQWDGFARYLGNHRTRIEINLDAALDVTRALRLACHEGYPGHHVQNVLIDDELVRKRGWQEFALTPSFGRHLLVTEGAAEAGADLVFPSTQRADVYRSTLLPAVGLPPNEADRLVRVEELIATLEPVIGEVSRAYLDNTLTQAAALDRLRAEALTPNPESLLAFAERRRSRLLAYPMGRAAIRRTIGDAGLAGLRRLFSERPFALGNYNPH